MKPDWKDAPDWAMWLAMDEDGTWYWFENEPTNEPIVEGGRFSVSGGDWCRAYVHGWETSLEERKSHDEEHS